MIGIEINGTFLTLYPDTQVSITEDNDFYTGGDPLFQLSPRSIPFNIPTQENQAVLLQSHIPESEYAFRYFENVNLYAGDGLSIGSVIHVGTLYVRDSDERSTQVFFVASQPEISEKTFNDVNLGFELISPTGDEDEVIQYANDTADDPLSYTTCTFPVYNPIYDGFDPEAPEVRRWQNWWYTVTGTFRPKGALADVRLIWTPFIRVNYLIDLIGQKLAFDIENLVQTAEEFQLLYLYNNTDLSYFVVSGTIEENYWTPIFHYKQLIPGRDRPMVEFLKTFAKLFCSGIFPDTVERKIWIIPYRDILESPHEFDWTDKMISAPKIQMENNFPSGMVFEQDANDEIFERNNFTNIADLGFGTPTEHLAQEDPTADGFYYLVGKDKYIRIQDGNVTFESQFFDKITTANTKGKDVKLEGAPLFQGPLSPMIETNGTKYIPGDLSSISQTFHSEWRFMLYRGKKTIDGSLRPFANNNAYDPDTLSEAYDYSLIFNGEKGIYKTWWEKWLLFLKDQKLVKMIFRLSISDLMNLRPYHKIMAGSNIYLIKSKSYSITMTGLSDVECTLIRCN